MHRFMKFGSSIEVRAKRGGGRRNLRHSWILLVLV